MAIMDVSVGSLPRTLGSSENVCVPLYQNSFQSSPTSALQFCLATTVSCVLQLKLRAKVIDPSGMEELRMFITPAS